jgi:hypothetical protein
MDVRETQEWVDHFYLKGLEVTGKGSRNKFTAMLSGMCLVASSLGEVLCIIGPSVGSDNFINCYALHRICLASMIY